MSRAYKVILADLDGTVNRGRTLIKGSVEIYEALRFQGIRWLFLSNNASSLASDLAEKLTKMGLSVTEDQTLNSASALIHALETDYRSAHVMVVGQDRLREGVAMAGAVVEDDPEKTDIVVTAMDRGFTYDRLARAHIALQRGARFWATNLDATFPVEDGFRPGAGSIAAAVQAVAGRPPDRVFGKPSTDMARMAFQRMGVAPGDCLVVGDRMETDILFAINAGVDSALVLTGATALEDLPRYDYAPDYVIETISDVTDVLDGAAVKGGWTRDG